MILPAAILRCGLYPHSSREVAAVAPSPGLKLPAADQEPSRPVLCDPLSPIEDSMLRGGRVVPTGCVFFLCCGMASHEHRSVSEMLICHVVAARKKGVV